MRVSAMRDFLLRHPGVTRLGVVILILVAWEIAARFFIDPLFISPPSRVFASLGSVWGTSGVPVLIRRGRPTASRSSMAGSMPRAWRIVAPRSSGLTGSFEG